MSLTNMTIANSYKDLLIIYNSIMVLYPQIGKLKVVMVLNLVQEFQMIA